MSTTTVRDQSRNVPEIDITLPNALRPADRAVAFLALAEACKEQAELAKQETLQLAEATGASSFRTPMGALTVTQKEAPLRVNDAALLQWVRERDESMIETIEQVKPWFAKQVIDQLVVIDGGVYHRDDVPDDIAWTVVDGDVVRVDGEVVAPVPFASVGEKPAPYATWTSSAAKKSGLAAVQRLFDAERDALAQRAIGAAQ